jgi:NADH:ubiquinone oxidoreductase subunit H
MNALVFTLVSLLVFPGVIFALVAALVLGALRGVTRAGTQGWAGIAPILSPREILRRTRQSSTSPAGLFAAAAQVLPIVALVCPILLLIFLPLPANRGADAIGFSADVVALVALLLGMPIARILLGWATPSPYTRLAAIRAARELMGYILLLALAVAVTVAIGGSIQVAGVVNNHPVIASPSSFFGIHADRLYEFARIAAGLTYLSCLPSLARLTSIREGQGSLELAGNELSELSGRELLVMRIAEWVQLVAALGLGITLFVLPFFSTVGARAIAAGITAIVVTIGLGAFEGSGFMRPRDELDPPFSIWFSTQSFLGIAGLLLLVLAQRYS